MSRRGSDDMEMPCMCECGEMVDLHDANACRYCPDLFCAECVPSPQEPCPKCADLYEPEKPVRPKPKWGSDIARGEE